MFKRIKLYWKNLKESQTMKEALLLKISGVTVLVAPHLGYFEGEMPPWAYGLIMIMFSFLAEYRRGKTTTPLSKR